MTRPTPYDLHASLGYQLTVTARIQERRLEEQLKSLGLTRVTWCVLLAVGAAGLHNPSAIAEYVGIDRTATSRALRRMQQDGLIERRAAKGDGRWTQVSLTAKGAACIDRGTPMAQSNNALMADILGGSDTDDLKRLLTRLRQAQNQPLSTL